MLAFRYLIDFSFTKEKYDVKDFLFKKNNKDDLDYIELIPLSGEKCNLPLGFFNEKIKVIRLDPTGVELYKSYYNKMEVFKDKIKLYE